MVNIDIRLRMNEIKNNYQHLFFHYFLTMKTPWNLHKFTWHENSFILEHDATNQFSFAI
jgi:hypothetical protein